MEQPSHSRERVFYRARPFGRHSIENFTPTRSSFRRKKKIEARNEAPGGFDDPLLRLKQVASRPLELLALALLLPAAGAAPIYFDGDVARWVFGMVYGPISLRYIVVGVIPVISVRWLRRFAIPDPDRSFEERDAAAIGRPVGGTEDLDGSEVSQRVPSSGSIRS